MKDYCFVLGVWGDVLVSIQECFKSGCKNILVASNQNDIENFILAQDFVDHVYKVKYDNITNHYYSLGIDHLSKYLSEELNDQINLIDCSVDAGNNRIRYDIYKNLKVDSKSEEWALEKLKHLPKDFILLYPYSINSSDKKAHWPHWDILVKYLLDKNMNVVLCGISIDHSKFDIYENFYDLSFTTSSFQQVFALAKFAQSVYTTSNGITFFCASNDILTYTFFNYSASNYFNGFNRTIYSKKLYKISYNSTFLEALSIINSSKRKDDIFEILACFPYLHKDEMYNLLLRKNETKYQDLKNNKYNSVYSKKPFDPLVFATLVLNNDRFIYHVKADDEIIENQILENVNYFKDIFKRDIDFKFIQKPLMNYDLIIE